jgi:hypothetical protein
MSIAGSAAAGLCKICGGTALPKEEETGKKQNSLLLGEIRDYSESLPAIHEAEEHLFCEQPKNRTQTNQNHPGKSAHRYVEHDSLKFRSCGANEDGTKRKKHKQCFSKETSHFLFLTAKAKLAANFLLFPDCSFNWNPGRVTETFRKAKKRGGPWKEKSVCAGSRAAQTVRVFQACGCFRPS